MIADSELPEDMKEIQSAGLTLLKQNAEADLCLRKILLSHFNEEIRKDCENCYICRNPRQGFDATTNSKKLYCRLPEPKKK